MIFHGKNQKITKYCYSKIISVFYSKQIELEKPCFCCYCFLHFHWKSEKFQTSTEIQFFFNQKTLESFKVEDQLTNTKICILIWANQSNEHKQHLILSLDSYDIWLKQLLDCLFLVGSYSLGDPLTHLSYTGYLGLFTAFFWGGHEVHGRGRNYLWNLRGTFFSLQVN